MYQNALEMAHQRRCTAEVPQLTCSHTEEMGEGDTTS
jgi:hypothetical protein